VRVNRYTLDVFSWWVVMYATRVLVDVEVMPLVVAGDPFWSPAD
jgi:hypothetical protein